ncbi:MAG: hypothetical protein LBE12_00215 [Planctomycetaceae bacterium]|jgi:hypothetical protein|nr:hypothetical protein [Planctomycetaceae bacterium]
MKFYFGSILFCNYLQGIIVFAQKMYFYRMATIYDLCGRELATLRGEAMNPPTFADLNNPSLLHTLTKTIYDGNRIDRMLGYFGSGVDDYIGTKYHYDRFNHLRATSSYSVQNGTETTFGPYNIRDYDWNGNSIAEAVFDQEPNWNDVTDNENYVTSTKQGRYQLTRNYYLANGYSYRRETFGSDSMKPVTRTDNFYDDSGRQIAVQEYNALRTETVYDSVGRVLETRTFDGKNLVAKTRQDYDELGRMIGQHYFTYPTNAKNIRKTGNDFVCQTVYFWYDNAGRIVTQANYGCGADILSNAPIPVRPKTAPQKSAKEYLVTHTIYDSITGKQIGTTDQRGVTNRIVHNALGQTLSSIVNYVPNGTSDDQNIETKYLYDGINNVVALIVINPTTGDQITKYLYEDTVNGRLQTSIFYPVSNDTNTNHNRVNITYFLDGNIKSLTDQNGSIHECKCE